MGAGLVGLAISPHVTVADEPFPSTEEYKAVRISDVEQIATNQLNDLAEQGWQFEGSLGNGLSAFRRSTTTRDIKTPLEGRWEYLSFEKDGVETSYKPGLFTLTVSGNGWTLEGALRPNTKRLTLTGNTFELRGTQQTPPRLPGDTGKTVAYGIFELQGDSLILCTTSNVDVRYAEQGLIKIPKSFETSGNSNRTYRLRRLPPSGLPPRSQGLRTMDSTYGMEAGTTRHRRPAVEAQRP